MSPGKRGGKEGAGDERSNGNFERKRTLLRKREERWKENFKKKKKYTPNIEWPFSLFRSPFSPSSLQRKRGQGGEEEKRERVRKGKKGRKTKREKRTHDRTLSKGLDGLWTTTLHIVVQAPSDRLFR